MGKVTVETLFKENKNLYSFSYELYTERAQSCQKRVKIKVSRKAWRTVYLTDGEIFKLVLVKFHALKKV
jgi:hypothetical protein